MIDYISIEGVTPYGPMREVQSRFVDLRAADKIPDTVFFLEHLPVITRGSGLQAGAASHSEGPHMPLSDQAKREYEYFEVERGGDLTMHVPFQLVVYPIVKLVDHDVGAFLRNWEQVFIDALVEEGFPAQRRKHATGVWMGENPKQLSKVVSMGIAVKNWVTYHGAAMNIANDLSSFAAISPCGFSSQVMCRVMPEGAVPTELEWKVMRNHWERRLMKHARLIFNNDNVTHRDSIFSELAR